MIGLKFGKWTVLNLDNNSKLICKCECGAVKAVLKASLKNGKSKSCGCLQKEISITKNSTHGMFGTRIYSRWNGIKGRCHNPKDKNYNNYGARGITVCKEWSESFETFYKDMGDPPFKGAQIDRIDNDKGYYKENCRWTTSKINSQNTRFNIFLTLEGETLCLIDWATKLKIGHTTLYWRHKQGWSDFDILSTPVNGKRRVEAQ